MAEVGSFDDWDVIDVAKAVCGLRSGELWCASSFGARQDPARVGTDSDWLTVTVGSGDVCGIRGTTLPGEIWCSFSGTATPYKVGNASNWMKVVANKWAGFDNINRGIKQDGSLWCWGHDVTESTGSAIIPSQSPVRFGTENDYADIAGGDGFHICAVTTDKKVRCFGIDGIGMLGNGEAYSETLVRVAL